MSNIKTDDLIVERLRAAQTDAEAEWYAEGVADGRRYVEDNGEPHLLRALEEWQYPADEDEYGTALATALQIDWEYILGEDTPVADQPSYVRGFVAGAMARWSDLKDRL